MSAHCCFTGCTLVNCPRCGFQRCTAELHICPPAPPLQMPTESPPGPASVSPPESPALSSVWVCESGDYGGRLTVGVYASPEDAALCLRAAYSPPYRVSWEPIRVDGDRAELVGHFEHVEGLSSQHVARYELTQMLVERASLQSRSARVLQLARARHDDDAIPPARMIVTCCGRDAADKTIKHGWRCLFRRYHESTRASS